MTNKMLVVKDFAVPKAVKVALWVGVSGALVYLVDNVANLNLDSTQQMLFLLVVNAVLAGGKKYFDEVRQ